MKDAMTNTNDRDADAVRYVVLWKIAAGLRHRLMGELQIIQFSAELGARLLESGTAEPKVRGCLDKILEQSVATVTTGLSIIEWLRPEQGSTTTIGNAVEQCVKTAGDDWNLRGITIATHMLTNDATVSKSAALELIVTSLLALTDLHPGAIDIEVTAEQFDAEVELRLRARTTDRSPEFPPLTLYRSLTCRDVVSLADAHGVACSCDGDGVTLRFALKAPAA